MEYIILKPNDGPTVDLSPEPSTAGFSIGLADRLELPPTFVNGKQSNFSQQISNVLSEIADEAATAKAGTPVSSMIMPPDAWLVFLAYMMGEGIVQGLAWDVVKVTLQKALSLLQGRGLAPRDPKERTSERDVHFSWSGYVEWKPLQNLFLKMQFHYENNRRIATKEKQPDNSDPAA